MNNGFTPPFQTVYIGRQYKYQGNSKTFKDKLVEVTSIDRITQGFVHIARIGDKGQRTADTGEVNPNWLAQPGSKSPLKQWNDQQKASDKSEVKAIENGVFGLDDPEIQEEMEL